MDPFQGIIVQVLSNREPVDLYDDPDAAENEHERTRNHYVEAVTGAKFMVKVMLTTDFNLYHLRPEDAIRIRMNLDGRQVSWYRDVPRDEIEKNHLRGEPGCHTFEAVTHFCHRTGQWMRSDFVFGELKTKEDASTDLSKDRLKNLGKIDVKIIRMKRHMRSTPIPPTMSSGDELVDEVPEKALKGREISNTIVKANARPSKPPPVIEYDSKPLHGSAGKPVVYHIFYRSRNALKMLGCIPRSPSPAVEISDDEDCGNSPGVNGNASRDVHEEVRDLRARLALLERSTSIKTEAVAAVKREREDDDGCGRRQRPRTSVKLETIDLTDD